MSVAPAPRFDFFSEARQIDILDVLRVYSPNPIIQRNNRYWLVCPFHTEKTPSLHIDPHKGLWHCFGCLRGGDGIAFVAELFNLSPLEAAKRICEDFRLIPPNLTEDEQRRRKREREVKLRERQREQQLERQCVAYLQELHALRRALQRVQRKLLFFDKDFNVLELLIDDTIKRLTSNDKYERHNAVKEAEQVWNRWDNIIQRI